MGERTARIIRAVPVSGSACAMRLLKFVLLPLVALGLLASLYFWAALSWSYSTGERAGR